MTLTPASDPTIFHTSAQTAPLNRIVLPQTDTTLRLGNVEFSSKKRFNSEHDAPKDAAYVF